MHTYTTHVWRDARSHILFSAALQQHKTGNNQMSRRRVINQAVTFHTEHVIQRKETVKKLSTYWYETSQIYCRMKKARCKATHVTCYFLYEKGESKNIHLYPHIHIHKLRKGTREIYSDCQDYWMDVGTGWRLSVWCQWLRLPLPSSLSNRTFQILAGHMATQLKDHSSQTFLLLGVAGN